MSTYLIKIIWGFPLLNETISHSSNMLYNGKVAMVSKGSNLWNNLHTGFAVRSIVRENHVISYTRLSGHFTIQTKNNNKINNEQGDEGKKDKNGFDTTTP